MNHRNRTKAELIAEVQELRRLLDEACRERRDATLEAGPLRAPEQDDYRAIFDAVNDAIFVIDSETGAILDANLKMCEIYGFSRDEMKNMSIGAKSAGFPPYSQEDAVRWVKKAATEGPQRFEWLAKNKSNALFWVDVNLKVAMIGGRSFVLAVVRDITEHKQVEQELHVTRDYLRTVFNNVYDAIFVCAPDGRVVDVNDKMLEMYRVSREEAVQFCIIPDYSTAVHTYDNLLAIFQKALSGENQFFEWEAKRPKDNSVFDVEVYLTKLSLPDGPFILANVRDITERKATEKLLIKEREVFFSAMKNNPHGIALFDDDGEFIYFNPEFTAITDYSLEDVPTLRDWVRKAYPDAAYRAQVVRFWKADKLPEGRGKDVEWRIACKNGQNKDVEFRITYLGDKSLVVLTDTTARKRAEEELSAEKQKFETLSESSPMGMVMIGTDDVIRYVNPKFSELFGYDLSDLPNMKEWFRRAYPERSYRQQAIKKWKDDRKSLRPGEGRSYARKVTCKDSTQKHINYIPVRLETGEILITCEDITKSKEAEDKIRERNLELEVLNNIIASVSSSLHMPDIIEILKKVFVEKLRIPAGGIFFYDEPSNRLSLKMCWGIPDALREQFDTLALKAYSAGTIIDDNPVTFATNHIDYLQPSDVPLGRFFDKWQNRLCITLLGKGETQGLIFLIDEESNKLRDDHIAFYRTVGQQIGVAIQNARLFEQVRQSHTEMKALSLRLVEVQEAERRYIARELHDEIGQELTALKLTLEMNTRQSDGKTKANLAEAKSIVNNLMPLVRELSLNLRPTMLDDLGLLPTLPWHFDRFTNQTNIQVSFKHTGLDSKRFALQLETAIFRIVQEALTNVARHAGVNEVVVRLWSDEKALGVQIEDRGCSFDAVEVLKTGNTGGLYGMRERAMLLGGRFTIEAQPGHGTRLTAELPLDVSSYKVIDYDNN